MKFLTYSYARQIAEAHWGTGGTHSYSTNTTGAFNFSTSGHGGFVIDARVLTDEQRLSLRQFATPETVQIWMHNDKPCGLMHSAKRTAIRISAQAIKTEFEVFMLEEDCAWCLAYIFTPIRRRDDKPDTLQHAVTTYDNWYNPESPRVQASQREDAARENKDPDLIISAIQKGKYVSVTTADHKQHLVTGYANSRDEWGTPWLSKCEAAA